ncbi:hypothetical protein FC56_GL000260 [Lentilactobacillus senioris DSM 24302 = JCM 17472]|uniref:Uncharacterized protein n=1 Tax=Lentilactobacillus senioris DSM 24302 = JCM 17472 TaxID=1423802 RepID=A0A0R2CZF2_9LACO|nr:hypothetical protein [Lentilactobacillus senioris]KRM93547.1 hypothetical protein FC56_GL000260 [Lentilactobacillus senioris DSM 24302 = JCM 17472]
MAKNKRNKGRTYTGSTDMNGRKIYVGDFVEYCNTAPIVSMLYRSVVQEKDGSYTMVFEGGRSKMIPGRIPYTINYGEFSRVDPNLLTTDRKYTFIELPKNPELLEG